MPLPFSSTHHTQDAALARDLSTQSGALTGRFAGGSSAGVQGYAYQNAAIAALRDVHDPSVLKVHLIREWFIHSLSPVPQTKLSSLQHEPCCHADVDSLTI